MNDFTYHNIFETKGIEYLLTIAFFLILIPFWMLLNRKIKVREVVLQVKNIFNNALIAIPKGLFVSPNHTWAFMEKSGYARIGLDNLLVHLTGNSNLNFMKSKGDVVEKGELLTTVERDGKMLKIFSPVSGTIVGINTALTENPEKLKNDPYGHGWMFEIEPQKWPEEISSYYMADKALDWLQVEFNRIKDFLLLSTQKYLTPAEQLIMQDGGELVDDTLQDLPDEVWTDFQKEFLNRM